MNSQECQRFDMPRGARPLTAQIQDRINDRICLWMEVETDNPLISVPVYVIGTGTPFAKVNDSFLNLIHIDSVQMGYFVWHIYIGNTI